MEEITEVSGEIMTIPEFTSAEEFLTELRAFEWVYQFHNNKFTESRMLEKMSRFAQEKFKIRNFKSLYNDYLKEIKGNYSIMANYSNFDGQPMELITGDWEADNDGVKRTTSSEVQIACCHPIMPIERLINIDTGMEKLKLTFSKGKRWREIIVEKKIVANASKIIDLADYGIAVTSDTAKYLVKYLSEVESLNFDELPEKSSFSRLGYINNEGFIPYVDNLVFDGDLNYRTIFNSIKSCGDRDKWLDEIRAVRKYSTAAKITIAAAFASPLISVCNAQVFFTHLWSSGSGTGKTVALMCAASIWADPLLGKYIQTFNSTQVGQERLAAFLNQLPLMIDELQLNKGKDSFNVYQLSEGVGRSRGSKYGGIDTTPIWANSVITTGETPLISVFSGAGAYNRVIDIECKSTEKVIEDGLKTTSIIKNNYGFAGKEFVTLLYSSETMLQLVRDYFSKVYKELCQNDTTEKQAMAAALLVTADKFATDWIFGGGDSLTIEDISKYLATKSEVSLGERGYKYMCDWVSINANRFIRANCTSYDDRESGDIYGVLDADKAYVIASAFRRATEEAGYNSSSLLSYLKEHGLIETSKTKRGNTQRKRIRGVPTECVFLILPNETDESDIEDLDF